MIMILRYLPYSCLKSSCEYVMISLRKIGDCIIFGGELQDEF